MSDLKVEGFQVRCMFTSANDKKGHANWLFVCARVQFSWLVGLWNHQPARRSVHPVQRDREEEPDQEGPQTFHSCCSCRNFPDVMFLFADQRYLRAPYQEREGRGGCLDDRPQEDWYRVQGQREAQGRCHYHSLWWDLRSALWGQGKHKFSYFWATYVTHLLCIESLTAKRLSWLAS